MNPNIGTRIPTSGDNDRAAPRESVFFSAHLRRGSDSAGDFIRVRNISATGLMADRAEGHARAGDRVEVQLRGLGWRSGVIAWREGSRIGLAFDQPIDPTVPRREIR